jgi:hypothetical protein
MFSNYFNVLIFKIIFKKLFYPWALISDPRELGSDVGPINFGS